MRRRTSNARRRAAPIPEILRPHLFRRGVLCAPLELSPAISRRGRRAPERWLRPIPPEVAARLPRIRVSVFDHRKLPAGSVAQGVSFIPQRYLLLNDSLLSRSAELGRILYHELSHFLWPRLGNRRRALFETAVAREVKARVRGELGHSAQSAKQWWLGSRPAGKPSLVPGADWRHYLCESFCDTGAWALLQAAGHRRQHSEWTLSRGARPARLRAWKAAVS